MSVGLIIVHVTLTSEYAEIEVDQGGHGYESCRDQGHPVDVPPNVSLVVSQVRHGELNLAEVPSRGIIARQLQWLVQLGF